MSKSRSSWGSCKPIGRGVWRIRYWANGPDGYKRRSATVHGTRKDAETEKARLRIEHAKDAPCPTVGQCWSAWYEPMLEANVETGVSAPRTLTQYRSAWNKNVEPRWGKVPVDAVRPVQVQEWLNTKSPCVARRSLQLARAAVDFAVRYQMAQANPFAIPYVMPAKARKESDQQEIEKVWTMDELARVYRVVRDEYPHLMFLFLLAAGGGCRIGEATGAMADDVEMVEHAGFKAAVVPIVRQVTQDNNSTKRLKTEQSARYTVVPGFMGELVGELAERNAGSFLSDDGTGRSLRRHVTWYDWKEVCEKAGVDYLPPKDLRKSWRTYMQADLKVDPMLLEKMMGHKGKSVTEKHYFMPQREEVTKTICEAYATLPFAETWRTL